jgi:hypothetical protein
MSAEDALRIEFDNAANGFIAKDAQSAFEELSHRNLSETTATTLNGTKVLTATSPRVQFLTGTATGFSIQLQPANEVQLTWKHEIINTTNQTVSVKDGAGNLLFILDRLSNAQTTLRLNPNAAGTWTYWQILLSSIASGVINYNIDSATPFVSSARYPTYELITGFTVTPQAGQYALWYNASVYYTTTPKSHWWAFFKNAVIESGSERFQDTAHSNQTMIDSMMDILSFNGTDTLDIRVSCANTGSLTVNSRTLIMIRLGAPV